MGLFDTRKETDLALQTNLRDIAAVIEEGFVCLDECVRRLHKVDSPFARVSSLTLIKARNQLLAIYSLSLDGLAQEAGAILRPLIGNIEKLEYYLMSPDHIEEAINGELPTEGIIAKKIGGEFKPLREYLNKYSSHSNLSYESFKHLINFRDFSLRTVQPFSEKVLRKNLEMVFAFLIFAIMNGQKCVFASGKIDNEFAKFVEDLRDKGMRIIVRD